MSSNTALRRENQVAYLSLDEPERRNPLSPETVAGLHDQLRTLAADPEVRVVVIAGEGAGFCAGADLRRMREATPEEDQAEYDAVVELNKCLWNYPKPTIAAVHGFAMGAGLSLTLWCDLSIVEEDVRLAVPEVSLGIPAATVVPTLEKLIGRRRTLDLILTCRDLDVHEAERIGLITRAVAKGTSHSVAAELAAALAHSPAMAMQLTKRIVSHIAEMSYDASLEYAKNVKVMSRVSPGFRVRSERGERRTT